MSDMFKDAAAIEQRAVSTVLRALDLSRAGESDKISGFVRGDLDLFFRQAAYDQEKLGLFIRRLALSMVRTDLYSADVVYDLFGMLISSHPDDLEILREHAAASWLAAQHDPGDRRGVEAARRYVTAAPESPDAHRLLGSAALGCGLYLEAYLAYSAAAAVAGHDLYGMNRQLAKLLMQGADTVRFEYRGVDYMFELALFSTQAMEAAAHHACARLTEPDELDFVRGFVDRGAAVVEVGALVGNHTVFFLKNLAPRSIRVFEANPKAAATVERNIVRNRDESAAHPPAATRVVNAFVGAAARAAVPFAGTTAPCVRLSDAVREDAVDFVKIDVDGAELAVLAGAEELLAARRPKIMLEVNDVTRRDAVAWLAARGYAVEREIDRQGYGNLFLAPVPPAVRR